MGLVRSRCCRYLKQRLAGEPVGVVSSEFFFFRGGVREGGHLLSNRFGSGASQPFSETRRASALASSRCVHTLACFFSPLFPMYVIRGK